MSLSLSLSLSLCEKMCLVTSTQANEWLKGNKKLYEERKKFWKEDHIIKFSCESNLHFTPSLSLTPSLLSPFDHPKYQQWQSLKWFNIYIFQRKEANKEREERRLKKIFTNITSRWNSLIVHWRGHVLHSSFSIHLSLSLSLFTIFPRQEWKEVDDSHPPSSLFCLLVTF